MRTDTHVGISVQPHEGTEIKCREVKGEFATIDVHTVAIILQDSNTALRLAHAAFEATELLRRIEADG
jgi:hypothetical protein